MLLELRNIAHQNKRLANLQIYEVIFTQLVAFSSNCLPESPPSLARLQFLSRYNMHQAQLR
jgi:hypothetical protein